MKADGNSERSEFEPRISQMAQMNTTMT